MSLNEIVNVQISVDNVAVSRASFGTPLHVGLHKVFTERVRTYSGVQAMLDDGFPASSSEIAVATAIFSQEVTPTSILIGRRQGGGATVSPFITADNTDYSITIDGTLFTINSGVGATDESIATALFNAIDGNLTGTLQNVSDDVGELGLLPASNADNYTVQVSSNLQVVYDPGSESIVDSIQAVRDVNDTWYALTTDVQTSAEILDIAAYIETQKKIYAFSTADTDTLDAVNTDIFSILESFNYDRTFGLYDPDSPISYPEAAWLGVMLPKDPGSATWAYQTLIGQDADTLSQTQSGNVRGKNGNTYEEKGGVDITRYGTVASGEFVDIIRGIDWLESRIQERVFALLVSNDKIPFTEQGVAMVESEIRAQLQDAITAGVLAEDPAFTITTPVVADLTATVRATRCLPAITFEARLAGAIHKVIVTGSVSV